MSAPHAERTATGPAPAAAGPVAPDQRVGSLATAAGPGPRDGSTRSRSEAPTGTIPTQRTHPLDLTPAPAAPPTAPGAPSRAVRRAVAVVVLCPLLVGTVAAAVVVQLRADARATAWAHARERVAAQVAADATDAAVAATARAGAIATSYAAARDAAVAGAQRVIADARAAADASPHAGDEALAALRAATQAVEAAAAGLGEGTSVAVLRATSADVAAPQRTVVEAQTAWQAAEDARIEAERLAAERAAAEAAARAATARPSGGSRPAITRGGAAAAPAAAAPASAWAAGVSSSGIGGLGASINAARAANGLPALAVAGSSSLADHAAAMAAAGSIWHSGSDHIVGWVQPVSDEQMIQAYLNSPPHRAWILKDGVSTVSIGAVTYGGRLYTAMLFS
ncbi:hypothetical protein [Cellulomonas sp. C5510]|uniref:hypothetical protein n=1 Tax=Cellulomonas sp. C5510 TaxID=2871170 RepID=UPI001C986CFC|nr:hypothetical protein [Cellulomonas sp. C5510]QZN86181.1 hypothetical protein K5O09_02990 [Cellulomonas sp. C5510]